MANGADIVIELLPQAAPNTVNSFIYAASHGYLDHHAIERIVPGNWVDVSYTAFGHKELQYLIPNEFALNPDVTPLDSHPGCVCMGGYGEAGLASCEFFFRDKHGESHLVEDIQHQLFLFFGSIAAGNQSHTFHFADGSIGNDAEHGHFRFRYVVSQFFEVDACGE